jgi:uncharacterized coiled-coil DUF342 family protein
MEVALTISITMASISLVFFVITIFAFCEVYNKSKKLSREVEEIQKANIAYQMKCSEQNSEIDSLKEINSEWQTKYLHKCDELEQEENCRQYWFTEYEDIHLDLCKQLDIKDELRSIIEEMHKEIRNLRESLYYSSADIHNLNLDRGTSSLSDVILYQAQERREI